MTLPEEIAVIEARLRRRGWSFDEFFERANVTRSTWNRWKAEVADPGLSKWQHVIRVSKMKPADFIEAVEKREAQE